MNRDIDKDYRVTKQVRKMTFECRVCGSKFTLRRRDMDADPLTAGAFLMDHAQSHEDGTYKPSEPGGLTIHIFD